MLIVSHNLESLNSPLTEITQMSFRSGTSQQKLHSRFETHWSTEQQLETVLTFWPAKINFDQTGGINWF